MNRLARTSKLALAMAGAVLVSLGSNNAAAETPLSADAQKLAQQTICHQIALEKSAPASIASLRKVYEKDGLFAPYEKDYPDLMDAVMTGFGEKMQELMLRHQDGCIKAVGGIFSEQMSADQIGSSLAYLESESGKIQQDYLLKELLYREIIKQAERAFKGDITKAEAIEAYEFNITLASFAIYAQSGEEKGAPMVSFAQSETGIAFTGAMGEAVEPWRQWTGRLINLYQADIANAGRKAGREMICSQTKVKLSQRVERELCNRRL